VRAAGDRIAEASALSNMGNAYQRIGLLEESLDCQRRSLALVVEAGVANQECITRLNIVGTLTDLRRCHEALEEGERARSAIRTAGDEYLAARADALIGAALSVMDRLDDAATLFERCLEGMRRFSDVRGQIVTLDEDLAPVLFRLGRHDDAVRAWEQALELAKAVGNDRAAGLEAKLALVLGPGPE
jgi:tetratricopeptide (TPR) repeat protein